MPYLRLSTDKITECLEGLATTPEVEIDSRRRNLPHEIQSQWILTGSSRGGCVPIQNLRVLGKASQKCAKNRVELGLDIWSGKIRT